VTESITFLFTLFEKQRLLNAVGYFPSINTAGLAE